MRIQRLVLSSLVVALGYSGQHQSPARAAEAGTRGSPIIQVAPVGVWCDEAASFSIKVQNTTSVSLPFTFSLTDPTSGAAEFSLASKELLPPDVTLGMLTIDDTCDRATSNPCIRGAVVTSLKPGGTIELIARVEGLALRAGNASFQVAFQLAKNTPTIHKDLHVWLTRATTRTSCFLAQTV